ncbi:DUF7669 domain-containing protein [Umezawaea sp.]|uniref:DUF7669 domain-containing protein n=1 Tax=Umezawaea sp. TaxID=1955258 RepID=UPI002ED483B2
MPAAAGGGPRARPWWLDAVWTAVAAELRGHLRSGLRGVLTEDVVRFSTARALVAAGVDATGLRVEAPHPTLKGSRVDLVVGRDRPAALVEFKFPREPNGWNAPWTMTMGEVLKDFYRLAAYPGEVDRIFVYVEGARLRGYMAGVARRHGIDLDTDTVTLTPAAIASLPATASIAVGTDLTKHPVTATRFALIPVDDTLRLAVYHVDPQVDSASASRPDLGRWPNPVAAAPPPPSSAAARAGARREILDAVRAVLGRSGASTFTLAEIVAEMTRRHSGYAESTVRTMVTSHLCRDAPDHASTTYDDLERVSRGVYRLARD